MWDEVRWKRGHSRGAGGKEPCPAMEKRISTTLKEYEQRGYITTKQRIYLAHQFSSLKKESPQTYRSSHRITITPTG